jgi:hypothetical protein
MDVDLVLIAPLFAELVEGFVGAGDPVIPATEAKAACRINAADIRSGDDSSRAQRSRFEDGAS